jgi:beta-lactam-binding protein with PASTA domain
MQARNIQLSNLKGGGAAAAAPAAPLLPSQGVFRQKAWLPWWLIPILGLLALLAVLLFMLMPKNVTVPDVVGSASAFDAEKTLTKAELEVAPKTDEKVTKDAKPGTVIGQDPPAGEKAEKGSAVTLQIAIGNGKVTVPDITGKTASQAEQALRKAKLTLGQASPQPLDPAKKISSQIPEADQVVEEGKPVDIFFAEPGKGKNGASTNGAPANSGGGGDVTIPKIDGADTDTYAQSLSDKGLVPAKTPAFDASKTGTLFDTDPKAGTTVKSGTTVKLLVSAGFPSLAFDNDKDILQVNGASGAKLPAIAKSGSSEKDPAFSPDASRVAYVRDGRIMLARLGSSNARTLTPDGTDYADLAWAPDAQADVLAMGKVAGTDRDLCLGVVSENGMTPQCKTEPDVTIGGAIHWAPDGKAIYAGGVDNAKPGVFGVVRWKSRTPFSPNPDDWSAGKFVTDTSTPNDGVKEAAISPDGKRLALIGRKGNGPFELLLGKPGDFDNAKSTGVRACKLAWQPDSRALAIVQSDAVCSDPLGSLVRLQVDDPTKQDELNANGDNPVFQPLSLGG